MEGGNTFVREIFVSGNFEVYNFFMNLDDKKEVVLR